MRTSGGGREDAAVPCCLCSSKGEGARTGPTEGAQHLGEREGGREGRYHIDCRPVLCLMHCTEQDQNH